MYNDNNKRRQAEILKECIELQKDVNDYTTKIDRDIFDINIALLPFEFTFAPEWEYLDEPYLNFIIEVYDEDNDTLLCKTTVVVTKHSDVPAI